MFNFFRADSDTNCPNVDIYYWSRQKKHLEHILLVTFQPKKNRVVGRVVGNLVGMTHLAQIYY